MFPPSLLDTGCVGIRLENIEGIDLVPLVENSRHMEHAIMEDLHGNLLLGQFTAAVVENHNCHRIVSKSRGRYRLWISTLDTIALGFSPAQNSSLLDLDDSVLEWHIIQHFVRVQLHRIRVQNHCR